MQTILLDKYRAFIGIEAIHDGVLLFACISDLFKCIVVLRIRNKIVLRFRTGNFARPAPDTPGCIDKYSGEFLGFFRGVGLYVDVGYASRSNGSRSDEKLSSIHDMSYSKTGHWLKIIDQKLFFPE